MTVRPVRPVRAALPAAALALALCASASATAAPIEEVRVVGTPTDRYRTDRTDALTGFPMDFLELPRVVDVLPEQLLLDQKVTDLNDALRNVPGVTESDGFGGTNDDFFVRGFRRNTVYRDGLRRRSNFKTNTTNVERVEVIKGPAAIGFGQVEPGGLVNIVTKKPLDEPRTYLEARGGRWDNWFGLVDVSRPLTDRLAVRVNASVQDSESFRDFTEIERDVLALTARYAFSDRTRLDASFEYRDESRPLDRGTIAVPVPGGSREIVDTPRERRFGEPFEIFDTTFRFASLDLEHDFSEDWSLRLAGALEWSDSDDVQVRPRAILVFDESVDIVDGFFTAPATPEPFLDEASDQIFIARRVDGSQDREIDARYLNALLTGRFETGSIEHRVSFAADFRDTRETRVFALNPNTDGMTLPLFDIENPIYRQLTPTFTTGFPTEAETRDYGFSVQDAITVTDRFSALLGLRLDYADADGNGPLDRVDELSPQVALSYRLTETVSAFASWSEAFIPNTQTTIDLDGNVSTSDPFPPEDSRQMELGLKATFLDGTLNATAAVYDIEKENVVSGRGPTATLIDGQTSRGAEFSVSGQPLPGMNVVAGYAYTDAELPGGDRPRNVAEHTANLWTSYEFQDGRLRGLGAGAGLYHASNRYGDNANTWSLGSYTLVDASLWYTLPWGLTGRDESRPTRLQLSMKNLFDQTYYPASGFDSGQRINIGTPRSWFLSVTTRL